MSACSHIFRQLVSQNVNRIHLFKVAVPTCAIIRNYNIMPKLKEPVHCDYVDSMDYGIYSLNTGYIRETCIEASRIGITRKAKTKKIWKPVCESPFTKRPVGSRMGKGKGKLSYWAAKAIAGQRLFEFDADNDLLAQEAFRYLSNILPVRIELRIRPKEPKQVLDGNDLMAMFEKCEEREKRIEAYSSF